MKRAVFILICITVLLISCGLGGDSANIYSSLSAEDKAAINSIGKVYAVYGDKNEGARLVNGQTIETFKDLDGNPMSLVFTSKLVAYKTIDKTVADYVENLPTENAKMHHKYNGVEWRDDVTYVEYCTYKFQGNANHQRENNICYVEIRVFQGDFEQQHNTSDEWYAKSVLFDPELKYDLNKNTEISTGKPLKQYDPYTGNAVYDNLN